MKEITSLNIPEIVNLAWSMGANDLPTYIRKILEYDIEFRDFDKKIYTDITSGVVSLAGHAERKIYLDAKHTTPAEKAMLLGYHVYFILNRDTSKENSWLDREKFESIKKERQEPYVFSEKLTQRFINYQEHNKKVSKEKNSWNRFNFA